MNELVIRIKDSGEIAVEELVNGIKSYKRIEPDSLIKCIHSSIMRNGVFSGLLPANCLSFSQSDNGDRRVTLLFTENSADISYFGTIYTDFPLPRLVFGFSVNPDGRVFNCTLGVLANDTVLKPDSIMYCYPFSNVNGFHLCTGNNTFPKCKSFHTLGSLPYFIMSMANNNDYFKEENNKPRLSMRDLLEHLKDKEPAYYYSDILVPFDCKTLNDFINYGGGY